MERGWLAEFAGRAEEVQRLRALLSGEEGEQVIAISGMGGLGKTWLLSRFAAECAEEPHSNIAHLDLAERPSASPIGLLSSTCEQLRADSFPATTEIIDSYLAKLREVAGSSGSVSISGSVSVSIESSSFLEGVDDITGVKISQKSSSVPEAELRRMEDLYVERASQAFVREVAELSMDQPVRVFIDSLDRVEAPRGESFSRIARWIKQVLRLIVAQDVPASQLLLVVAGRQDAGWLRSVPVLRDRLWAIRLPYFTCKEVENYLFKRNLGALPSSTVRGLMDLTRGHPHCVALAADLLRDLVSSGEKPSLQVFGTYRGRFDERLISQFLVRRILERMPRETSSLIRQIAIPHWFAASTLRALRPEETDDARTLLDTVTGYSFVRRRQRTGYSYHAIVRDLLMRQWVHDDPEGLSAACCVIADSLSQSRLTGQLVDSHEHLQVEVCFHRLLCDSEAELPRICRLFNDAVRAYRISFCEALTATVEEVASLIERLDPWSVYFHGRLLSMQGNWEEAISRFRELVSSDRSTVCPSLLLAETYGSLGSVMQRRGDLDQAVDMLRSSLDIRREEEDIPGMVRTLNELGTAYRTRIEWEEAEDCYRRAQQLAQQTDSDPFARDLAYSSLYLGVILTGKGNYDSALEAYERSLTIYKRIGDQYGAARANQRLGWIARIRGDFGGSLHYHELALETFRKLGYPHSLAECLHSKGTVHRQRGEYRDAQAHYEEALAIFRELGATRHIGIILNDIGLLFRAKGELERAVQLCEESLEIRLQAGHKTEAGTTLNNLGELYMEMERWEDAERCLERGLAIARQIDCTINIVRALVSLCDLHYRQNRLGKIDALAEEAGTLGERDGYNHYVAKLYRIYGAAYLRSDDTIQAARTFVQSLLFARQYNAALVVQILQSIRKASGPELRVSLRDRMLRELPERCADTAVTEVLEREITRSLS